MVSSKSNGRPNEDRERQGFRATVSRAFNQVAMAGLASCDERAQRKELFQDELVIHRDDSNQPTDSQDGIFHVINRMTQGIGGVGTSAGQDSSPDNPRIWGSHKFRFNVQQQVVDGPDGGIQLVASAFSSGGYPLSLHCAWKRKFGQSAMPVGASGTTYSITADDIGAKVLLEVHADDEPGSAYAEFGPFEIDGPLRRQLESMIQADGTELPIEITSVQTSADRDHFGRDHLNDSVLDDPNKTDQGVVVISEKDLTVKRRSTGGRLTNEAMGRFGGEYPEISLKGLRGFVIKLAPQTTVRGSCQSRAQRDFFVMAVRLFRGRHAIGMDAMVELVSRQYSMDMNNKETRSIIENQVSPTFNNSAEPHELTSGILDLTLYAQRLSSMLNDTALKLTKEQTSTKKLIQERENMQEELQATISAYQAIITDLQDEQTSGDAKATDSSHRRTHSRDSHRRSSVDVCTACTDKDAKIIELQKVYEHQKDENKATTTELRSMKDRYAQVLRMGEQERKQRSVGEMKSREELNLTKTQIYDYKRKNEEFQSKIKRLEKEKADLTTNFLYTKQKLDELVRANKLLELDKTRMMDSTRHINGDAEQTIQTLKAQNQALTSENEKLRERIRCLADME